MKKTLLVLIPAAAIAVVCLTAYAWIDLNDYLKKPADPTNNTRFIVTVSPGQRFDSVVKKLYRDRLITHPFKFKLIARLKKYDRKIIAGVYDFSPAMPPAAILDRLVKGKIRLYKVTIPEGFNLKQVSKKVEEAGLCSREAFLSAATDPAFARRMGIPAKTFEGYLFPDTYYFSKDVTPEQIIISMVKQLRRTFNRDWRARARALGFTVHEILTLASIIEKETGVDAERPIISSVFHNRLKRNIRLASDPTVIYGIKSFNGNLTRRDMTRYTPYNTYMISGLPPGPIANPGKASIRAALFPAKTDYLYFVAKPDKTHQFSATLSEHNRAVRKYQLRHGIRRP